jgi:hypothetical protein
MRAAVYNAGRFRDKTAIQGDFKPADSPEILSTNRTSAGGMHTIRVSQGL